MNSELELLIKENIDSKYLNEKSHLRIISAENYMSILKDNQSKIIEINRDYIQKFVKIGSYLKSTQKKVIRRAKRVDKLLK